MLIRSDSTQSIYNLKKIFFKKSVSEEGIHTDIWWKVYSELILAALNWFETLGVCWISYDDGVADVSESRLPSAT